MHALALAAHLAVAKAKKAKDVPAPARTYDVQSYAIALDLDAPSGDFSTTTAITLKPTAPTSVVELDVRDLEIAAVKQGEAELQHQLKPGENGNQLLQVTLAGPADPGAPVRLVIKARGHASVGGDLGLIKAEDPQNPGRVVYYTMFEPDGARRVFPCNDDAADKATTELSVTTDAKLQVISNGEQTADEPVEGAEGKHRVSWKLDQPQSTYLVAVAVGPFEALPLRDAPVTAAFQLPPGQGSRATYAGQATKAGMAFLADFLQTPYPWSRYDQVAIPDFTWWGMENTSVTFLRQSALLPPSDALAGRNNLAGLVDHELAHQWFGDLVTPASWREVWLNESFATYLQRIAHAQWSKNDHAYVEAALQLRDSYFRFEDGPRSHPVTGAALSPADAFDEANYQKGAAVLRMLEKIVGRDAFRRALKSYLAAHAHGTATTDDLFSALTTASGKDLGPFRKAWLEEAGYPVIKVSHRWVEADKQALLIIDQKPNKAGKKVVWPATLPIVAHRTAEPSYQLEVPVSLEHASETIAVPLPAEPEWIDWNQGDTVLARLESNEKLEALRAQVQKDPDPMSRLWAELELAGPLADPDRKGPNPSDDALSTLGQALREDRSPYVREGVLRELVRGTAKRFPAALSGPILEEATAPQHLPDDPMGVAELRKYALAALGKVDDPSVPGILAKPLKDPNASLDLVEGASLGLGHRADATSIAALTAALPVAAQRGFHYELAVLWGLATVEDPAVAPSLLEQARAHKGSVEVLREIARALQDNRNLVRSTAGTQMVGTLAGEAGFAVEARAGFLNLLDDVKTPAAKAELLKLAKDPNPRLAASAKQKLKGNFNVTVK